MKKIIYGAMAAAALLACSKEQVIEQNRANDEIGFSVVAENQTKAEAVYDSNNTMEAFTVAATYTKDGSTSWYFQNDLITKVQNGENYAWENTAATRYWSADGTHDFYAIVNGEMTMAAPTAAPTVNFKPDTDVAKQKDLLYAVTKGLKKSDNKEVALNFRHALSQIQFKAKNTNPKLHVKISGVHVGNIQGEGKFNYPTETRPAEWVHLTDTPTDYTVTFDEVEVAGDSKSVDLTCTKEKSMLLIPAYSGPWAPERGEGNPPPYAMRSTASAGASDGTGSYIAVKCQIYNVAGDAYASTDVCLYEGWAVIGAFFDWEQGKKYIYTLVFGEGDFGYNGGNGDTPIPDEEKVLTTMNYTVTVDDFTDVAETEDMKTFG